jgi:cytidine deaminase
LNGVSRQEEKDLEKKALDAMRYSYSPYSKITVGASILCDDGSIYSGTNIENASYGITLCAERVALFKAVSEGHRKFKAIMIASTAGPLTPCGSCRQALFEFNPEIEVMVMHDAKNERWKLKELLPVGFSIPKKQEIY